MSHETIEDFRPELDDLIAYCAFCYRPKDAVTHLFRSDDADIYICNDCVRDYRKRLQQWRIESTVDMSLLEESTRQAFALEDLANSALRPSANDEPPSISVAEERSPGNTLAEQLLEDALRLSRRLPPEEHSNERQADKSGLDAPSSDHESPPSVCSEGPTPCVDSISATRIELHETNVKATPQTGRSASDNYVASYCEAIIHDPVFHRWEMADQQYLEHGMHIDVPGHEAAIEFLPVYIAMSRPSPIDPKQPLDPYRALLDQKRAMLLGDTGSGKTSLCEQLVLRVAKASQSGLIPVLVRLCNLQRDKDIYGIVYEELLSHGLPELTLEQTKQLIQDGARTFWFFFDGLNELPGDVDQQREQYDQVVSFVRSNSHHQYTITCDWAEFSRLIPGFEQWEIMPLLDDTCWHGTGRSHVSEYISRRLRAEASEVIQQVADCGIPADELPDDHLTNLDNVGIAAERFYLRLRRDETLRGWARYPLFLRFLYEAATHSGILPTTKYDMCREYVARQLGSKLPSEIRHRIETALSSIGLYFCIAGIMRAQKAPLAEEIATAMGDSRSTVQSTFDAAFQFGQIIVNMGTYVLFAHPIIRDYFACQWLTQQPQLEELIPSLATNPNWRGAILLFLQLETAFRNAQNLQKLMVSDADLRVRVECGNILGEIGDSRFVAPIMPPEWISVEGGATVLGDDEFDPDRLKHTVMVEPFRIARFPITRAQYSQFVTSGLHPTPQDWYREKFQPSMSSHPVVYVSWHDAQAYCHWLTLLMRKSGEITDDLVVRLPTEAEWERAARGLDERSYPWGNMWDDHKCNTSESGLLKTSPVGIYPNGASRFGVEELAGNVFEWTSSAWGREWSFSDHTYPYSTEDGREDTDLLNYRVLRGGAWGHDRTYALCSYRHRALPGTTTYAYGFRPVLAKPINKDSTGAIQYGSNISAAKALLDEGKAFDAGRLLDDLWKRGRLGMDDWLVVLTTLERLGNYKQLGDLYQTWIQGVHDSRIHSLLAYCNFQAGNHDGAYNFSHDAVEIAASATWTGQTGKWFSECASESDPVAVSFYSLILGYTEHADWVWGYVAPVHRMRERPPESYVFLGDLFLRLKKAETAIEEYSSAIQLSGSFWKMHAYRGRALAYSQQGQPDSELDDLRALERIATEMLVPFCQNYHAPYYLAFAKCALAQRTEITWQAAANQVRKALLHPNPRYVSELRLQLTSYNLDPSTTESIKEMLHFLEIAEKNLADTEAAG